MTTETRKDLLSTTSATLVSSPVTRWLANIIWLSIAVLCVGLFLVDMTEDYSQIRTPCDGVATVSGECNFLSISSAEADVLTSWGLKVDHYAAFMTIPSIGVALFYVLPGLLILWQKGTSVIGLTASLALVVMPYALYSSDVHWAEIHPDLAIFGTAASIIGNSIAIAFFYLLPNGRFSPRWAYIPLIILIAMTPVIALEFNDYISIDESLKRLIYQGLTVFALLTMCLQIYRYFYDSNPEEKQQTKLILVGILLYFSTVFLWLFTYSGEISIPAGSPRLLLQAGGAVVNFFLIPALPVCITIAIMRYGLWDIDVAINRSLVSIAVTLVLGLVFVVSAFVIQSLLNAENPVFGYAVSAIGPLLIFNPTRKRVRHFIDRRIYGFAFDLNELNAGNRQVRIENSGVLTGLSLGGYQVMDVIGKGGMGEVYRGQGKDGMVAIKTMLPDIARNAEMRKRFTREAEAGQRLKHPSIARVYGHGDHDGTPYLIMEFVEGGDLRQQLEAGEAYDIETAITIMGQICDALDTAHAQGYVHRDIKPANMVRRANGAVVLMDFGITKVENASVGLTGTGVVGTITYMAPEQIMAARDVDHRADIYALGVVLFELLTGQVPFGGAPAQVLFAHLQKPVPDPCEIDPSIPYEIGDAILKAMQKNPDDRFQSAGAFAAELKRVDLRVSA